MTCQSTTSTCNCIPGGDKVLRLEFSDGTTQTITLEPNYEEQYFEIQPVITSRVTIRVMSVYSNPKTCPPRSGCEWWQPACRDWCPNGAHRIEILATQSWVEVYDWESSYMSNYSMRAALVSRTASLLLRQRDRDVAVFESSTPLLINASILQHGYDTNSDQELVVCRSWDRDRARWSTRGVIHNGQMQGAALGFKGRGASHVCAAYFTGDFTLVLQETPARYRLVNVSGVDLDEVHEAGYFNLSVFAFFMLTLLTYAGVSLWNFLKWLEEWRVTEVDRLKVSLPPLPVGVPAHALCPAHVADLARVGLSSDYGSAFLCLAH